MEAEADRRGFYSKAKKEAELLVSQFKVSHPECETIIVRPGLVYGKASNNNLSNAGVSLGRLLLVYGLGKRQLGLNYVKNLSKALVKFGMPDYQVTDSVVNVVDDEQPTVKEYLRKHNAIALKKVIAIYVPIFIWKMAFKTVDIALNAIRKKNLDFSYRFNSNSKTLSYENKVFGDEYIVNDFIAFNEALKKTLSIEGFKETLDKK